MKISSECFKDGELIRFIEAQGKVDCCDFSGKKQVRTIELEELKDFLLALISLYEPVSEGGLSIEDCLEKYTPIFSSKDIAGKVMAHMTEEPKQAPRSYTLKSSLINDSYSWGKTKHSVKSEYRFFTSMREYIEPFLPVYETSLPIGKILYRARLTPPTQEGKVEGLSKQKMGAPPCDKASSGRANPAGISYLYLCGDEITPLYEIRSNKGDIATLGSFEVKTELKIFDFNKTPSYFKLFGEYSEIEGIFLSHKLLREVEDDMSKPKRSTDSELEYIPTQYICEFLKLKEYDGVCFHSSLKSDGINIVLFNPENAACVETKLVKILNVDILYEDLSPPN